MHRDMTDAATVRALVARELTLIEDHNRREALRAILVEPRQEIRAWNYGVPGEQYACWVVAHAPAEGVILAYCELGFGPEMPWGFLPSDRSEDDSLGMDAQWDSYLEGAFVRAGLWKGVDRGEDEPFQLSPEERGLR